MDDIKSDKKMEGILVELFNGFSMTSLAKGEAVPKTGVIASSNSTHVDNERCVHYFSVCTKVWGWIQNF